MSRRRLILADMTWAIVMGATYIKIIAGSLWSDFPVSFVGPGCNGSCLSLAHLWSLIMSRTGEAGEVLTVKRLSLERHLVSFLRVAAATVKRLTDISSRMIVRIFSMSNVRSPVKQECRNTTAFYVRSRLDPCLLEGSRL